MGRGDAKGKGGRRRKEEKEGGGGGEEEGKVMGRGDYPPARA